MQNKNIKMSQFEVETLLNYFILRLSFKKKILQIIEKEFSEFVLTSTPGTIIFIKCTELDVR